MNVIKEIEKLTDIDFEPFEFNVEKIKSNIIEIENDIKGYKDKIYSLQNAKDELEILKLLNDYDELISIGFDIQEFNFTIDQVLKMILLEYNNNLSELELKKICLENVLSRIEIKVKHV